MVCIDLKACFFLRRVDSGSWLPDMLAQGGLGQSIFLIPILRALICSLLWQLLVILECCVWDGALSCFFSFLHNQDSLGPLR